MPEKPTHSPIEIRIEEVSQLFNTFDPFPFRDRDLDKDAEEFIVGWAQELPKNEPIRIVVHLPAAEAKQGKAHELSGSLNRYFDYRAEIVGFDLKQLFRIGRRSLGVGLVMLAICLITGRLVTGYLGSTEFGRFIQEGLVILGWVANWKPIEIFLYDWWPLVQRRSLYRRLARATVEIQAKSSASP